MSYHLGIDLGTTYTAAAISRDSNARIVELGRRTATIPSVVFLREDETILAGEPADRRALTEPGRVAREFKRRIGDPTPIMVGGVPYSADRLASKLLRWVVDHVTEREGSAPASITVTHPANWGAFKHDLLEQAIRNADLEGAHTITEPEAAAIYYSSLERVETGTLLGVYDLGGGTFDAAVLRKTPDGFEVLGRPDGIERLGGIDFDEAVFSHVRRSIGGALDNLDPDDQTAMTAASRIRRDCVEAKEALSADTEAVIPVMLSNLQTEVRLTRMEFEAMIRPSLAETIQAMQRALRSAGVTADDLSSILLVGGSSRIPLVSQLVTNELGRPISLDVHPKHAIALGAAMVSAERATPQPESAGTPEPSLGKPEVDSEPEPVPPTAPSLAEPRARSVEKTIEIDRPIKKPQVGIIAAAIGLVAVVIVAIAMMGGGDEPTTTEPPEEAVDVTVASTSPTTIPASTTTPETTTTTSTTTTTTPLWPVGVEAARFISIDLVGETYMASYEANYEPLISSDPSSHHLHFFWDLFDPATVGTNEPSASRGSWKLWDTNGAGELVFDEWTLSDRPAGASAICVVPATSTHEVANVDRVLEIYRCMALPPVEALSLAWSALLPGDCVNAAGLEEESLTVLSLSGCWSPHDAEIYSFGVYDDGPFPGLEALAADGDAFCLDEFAGYVGAAYDDSALFYDFLIPTADSWADGDRELMCFLYADIPLEFPAFGSGV